MGSQLRGGELRAEDSEGGWGPGHHTVVSKCFDSRGQAEAEAGEPWLDQEVPDRTRAGVRGGHSQEEGVG